MQLTILFGMICALAFIPMMMVLNSITYGVIPFRLIVWGYLVVYTVLLTLWGKKPVKLIVFPLLLLFIIGMFEYSNTVFFLVLLGILSWIRSSLCFQTSLLMMLVTEFMISLGGGALVILFHPQTQLAWALGIWMFFLVQSLYFVSWEDRKAIEEGEQGIDPFERASRQVEKILSEPQLKS